PAERLCRATRSSVTFSPAVQTLEARPPSIDDALRAVPGDRETGAALGSVGSEGGHDHQSTRRNCGAQHASIPLPLLRLDEEVEEGPVMPDAVRPGWLPLEEVLTQPLNPGFLLTEARTGQLQRLRREV